MMSRTHQLARSQLVPRPLSEVFAFFADARNLEVITPPFLRFSILTPMPIEIGTGSQLDYRLSLFGVPLSWRTRITDWQPNARFVDEQESGPYALWRHTHEFEANGESTIMTDVVQYSLPMGPLGGMAHGLFVRGTLERIFDYRREAIDRLLGDSSGNAWSANPEKNHAAAE